MGELPDGLVTFLFTDIEGSTRLWEEAAGSMMEALQVHDAVIDDALADHGGVSVKPRGEGDSRFIVFHTAHDAVAAAAAMQKGLAAVDWPTPRPLKARASLHTGTADLQLGDYYGSAVNRAARLRAIAHGGQTVVSATTWELVQDQLPEGVSIRDMGQHALKDLTRPEHVYQLDVAGLPDSFPPLASLDAIPNNLPQQLTEFVGRHSELADAIHLLGETRLLSILAPGGTGKTRLAIQAAADVTGDYPDGVFFVNLADISFSDEIIQALAESIGISLSADEPEQTQLLNYLAPKSQLLVFDNFEHVIDGAPLITAILKAAPNVTVLTTSRAKLNVTGETTLALGGLETEWERPEDAIKTSGVQLFIDAAKRANPAFALGNDDLDSLAEILRLTGGMPLGILLAAAWVDMLPIDEIAGEVARSLDFLETEMGDVPDRHRSVRAVFDYSWELLNSDERDTFAALSVFRGGFSREAASTIAGASLRNLATLVNKSLVSPSPETGRYSVHELLRQYAQAELESDEVRCKEVQDAHAEFYADLTAKAFELFDVSDQPTMLTMVEDDIENIRLAWRHLLANHDGTNIRKMFAGLHILYEVRGWYQAAVSLFGEVAELPSDSDNEAVHLARSMAILTRAWFVSVLGQPEEEGILEAAQALRDSGDTKALWNGLQCLAIAFSYLGKVDAMIDATDEVISVGQSFENPLYEAGGRNWRSLAAFLAQDLETTKEMSSTAISVFEGIDEHYFMTWSLWLQALVATGEQRPLDAIELHTKQVARSKEIGYRRGLTVAYEGLGWANLAAGRLDAAERAFIESLATTEQMSMALDMLSMMTKVATVWTEMGRGEEAVELLATVLAEPRSTQMTMSDMVPINELAAGPLDKLRSDLDPDVFASAQDRGAVRPYEVAAKELLQTLI